MKLFKPMLASPADLATLRFPLVASPKLDGIRAMVRGGRVLSRKLLDIPNKYVQELLSRPEFEGMDGELIVGEPTDHDVYTKTVSFVMSQDKIGPFVYHVFDLHDQPDLPYIERNALLWKQSKGRTPTHVKLLPHVDIFNREHFDKYEAEMIELGYEGIMTRDAHGPYKYGRSTTKEQILLKVKRFVDSECEIIGIQEEMHNANEAGRDELGRTKRSSAKDGKIGKGTMGALIVRDLVTKVEFNIGTGFTAVQRHAEWAIGSVHIYKSFPIGVKDKPRHPVYKGVRASFDHGKVAKT